MPGLWWWSVMFRGKCENCSRLTVIRVVRGLMLCGQCEGVAGRVSESV